MSQTVVFFGSFGEYSALVLAELLKSPDLKISLVVTTPPAPDRKGVLVQNPVHRLALEHELAILTELPSSFAAIGPNFKADFIITAGYGKLLPGALLAEPRVAALNLHFSLLPKYRGANPGEWAILMGEKESGITVIKMNEKFDQGGILFTAKVPLLATDTRETLYHKLYLLGGKCLSGVAMDVAQHQLRPTPQEETDLPYASRFRREDGFIEFEAIQNLMAGKSAPFTALGPLMQKIATILGLTAIDANFVERASRALFGFPSLWTTVQTSKGTKRLKLLELAVKNDALELIQVQLEGGTAASWNEIKNGVKI